VGLRLAASLLGVVVVHIGVGGREKAPVALGDGTSEGRADRGNGSKA
jgi:hypothetical protein